MKRSHCLLILLELLVCSYSWGTIVYSTARLRAMASILSLPGIDTLSSGCYTKYAYKSHPLTVRINAWGEVGHIGLKLFEEELKKDHPLHVYDFLERYLLERNLVKGTQEEIRWGFDHVFFEVGGISDVLSLDGTETFRLTSQSLKSYQAEWVKENKVCLSMRFDMDYQLLSGCNTIELEKNYKRELARYHADGKRQFSQEIVFPESGDYYVKEGNSFMIDVIRNDLYYQKVKKQWRLVSDCGKAFQSIANTMISRETEGDYELAVTLDMYGYEQACDTVRLYDWLTLCEEEGCTSYFGMKAKVDSAYIGTVFMVNEACGYLHLLSVRFPITTLKERKGLIEGRLFVYIPLHNVSEELFINTYYKQTNEEEELSDDSSVAAGDSDGSKCPANR